MDDTCEKPSVDIPNNTQRSESLSHTKYYYSEEPSRGK